MRIHVGTSGYNYPEWRGTFYPDKLPAKEMFAFYAGAVPTVEINYTFYRMPTAKTTTAWRDQAPAGLHLHAEGARRRITHIRRLKDAGDERGVASARARAECSGRTWAPLLFQLPPNLKCDVARLAAFRGGLPADVQAGFRVPPRLLAERRGVRRARVEARGAVRSPTSATGRRPSGPRRVTAISGFATRATAGATWTRWADRSRRAVRQAWDDVFVYFKHEDEGKGPEFAQRLHGDPEPAPSGPLSAQRLRVHAGREKRAPPRFRPVPVARRAVGDEAAMPAVPLRLADGDMRVIGDTPVSRNCRPGTNGSSSAVEDECWNADAVDHPHRARLVVVVARAREPVMRRGVDLIEFANASRFGRAA